MNSRSFCHSFITDAKAESLYLVGQPVLASAKQVTANTDMDVVAIIDVSGSMSADLPEFKRELANMLPRFLQGGDTFSLIYFSGPNQAAVLIDKACIRSGGERLLDISSVQKAIAGLDVIGLTCFTDPLLIAANFGERLVKDRPKARKTLIFASDGYDNTSPGYSSSERRKNIFNALEKAAGHFDRVVTMGVGWCVDQTILQEMAARCGGQFLFSRDIGLFNREFETAASKRPAGVEEAEVRLDGNPEENVAFAIIDGEIRQFNVQWDADDAFAQHVPKNAGMVWYVSKRAVGDVLPSMPMITKPMQGKEPEALTAAYAALVLFAQRTKRKLTRVIAGGLGDKRLISYALGAFGPQRYTDLAEAARLGFEGAARFVEGWSEFKPADPYAFTVLDALAALYEGDNRILPDHEGFKYTPITRGRLNAGAFVTADEVKQIEALVDGLETDLKQKVFDELRKIKVGDSAGVLSGAIVHFAQGSEILKDASSGLTEIIHAKAPAATYKFQPAPGGYPIDGLVFASEEANVSIRITRACEVDLAGALGALPETTRSKVPTKFDTFRYQQYTVITGRILNVSRLPVILDAKTWKKFAAEGLVRGPYRDEPVVLHLDSLPLINDGMIEELSAKQLVAKAFELEQVKAALKVFKDAKKTYVPKEESSAVNMWVSQLGLDGPAREEVKSWLENLGITDNGYSPSTTQAPKKDKRRSWLLDVSIPGLAKLPSVKDVRDKIAKIEAWKAKPKGKEPKLTFGESLMFPAVEKFDATFPSQRTLVATSKEHQQRLETWLKAEGRH